MADYYHHFLSSMVGAGEQPSPNQLDSVGHLSQPQIMPIGSSPAPTSYQSLGYYTGFPEPIMFNAPKAQRSRRKSAPGLDHIKHRRTRSGCYTCRSRRVKCDETHPICEKCIYPELPPAKGSKDSAGPSQQASPTSSRGEDDDEVDQEMKLDPILDEDEDEPESATSQMSLPNFPLRRSSTTSSFGRQKKAAGRRQGSETPSWDGTKSSSPSLSAGITTVHTPAGLQFSDGSTTVAIPPRLNWTFLPYELQFYLNYFYDNITHYHYCTNKPLLYTVVGFSAVNEFLQYYSRSLATIEEYLGDWVNLMGHQKAAFEVLNQLFTPKTIMQIPAGRVALMWYTRFDVVVGIMGSFKTSLSPDWYTTPMFDLFARGAKKELTEEEYTDEWYKSWDPALTDPAFYVNDFPGHPTPSPDNIVNPFAPGVLFRPPLFASTLLTCKYHSISLIHVSQSGAKLTDEDRARLRKHAYAICQIFETVELWPWSPPGSLVVLQSCLAIAALYMRRDPKHHMWIRRKFALLETIGYISPITVRTCMAELFEDESCLQWWLPNDQRFSPLLQNIRAIADDRNAMAVRDHGFGLTQQG
ncbi:hypothetical protein B0J18DRAFT_447030 [Chaetomium sp. MPI-SDFR-AT-0129]|nr:hypothetical protein B0J18DRAFT_447030 [Chaetomium sp. MPI-SDFR-AT-0129]